MRKFLLLVFTINIFFAASAQKFSNDVNQFVGELQQIMQKSNNEKLIQIGQEFSSVYPDLPNPQKASIYKLCNELKAKRSGAPLYGYYLGGIVAATNGDVSSEQLTQYLDVSSKTFEKDGPKKFQDYIKNASKFLIDLYLYKDKYYSYQIDGGKFSFEYTDQQQEETVVDQYEEAQKEKEEEVEKDPFETWDENDGGNEDDVVDTETWADEEENTEEVDAADVMNYGFQTPSQPPVSGPVIKVENVNITINSPNDSGVVIENTSGRYMLITNQFVGEGGKFDWSNNPDNTVEANVTLGGYNFKTEGKVMIKSENAKLNYKSATDQEVDGAFEYRSIPHNGDKKAQYPQFISYQSKIEIKNFGEGVQYFGGLSLKGSSQSSKSVYGDGSTIIVKIGDEEKFRAKAMEFEINDSLITSKRAYILVHAGEDSLLHFGMYLKYNHQEQKLTFYKGPKSSEQGPFFDTRHNVEITAEKLYWNLNETNIYFSMIYAGNLKAATVQSIDFYTDGHYTRLQGLARFHPLTMLMNFSKKQKSDEVYLADFVKFSNQPVKILRQSMTKLSREGYIHFTPGTGKIVVKRKAKLYASARRKKADWDQLLIFSKSHSKNITYDLESGDLEVIGVDDFMISVAQNVQAYPDSGKVILRGNRDLFFDGKVHSGQFQFTGTDYRFDYDSFFVDMSKIDSIRLKYNVTDSTSEEEEEEHTLGNRLVYSSGVLYVDRDNNKSHKKNYPEYPIFDATTGAYVYFDHKDILNHAYDTTVYFRIPPFVIDSLNSTDPNSVSFQGTFYGGDILEPFDETLIIMPDYSFGFVHTIPKKGHKVYGGKGIIYDTLTLNKGGIRSNGSIDYLTTTVNSNDFVFFLDSVTTDSGSTARMEQGELNGVLYPAARVKNYAMNWKAMEDQMHITNRDSVINLYDSKASLDGTLTATPTGTLGKGKAISGRAFTESQEMSFSRDYFKARNADFYVKAADEFDSLPTIKADSVFLDYNMIEQYADFGPEVEGMASIEFPFMQYKTSISNGRWDMVENTVTMVRNREEDIYYSYFYSTHAEQDSLAFNADSAVCDLDKSILNVYGVPFIKVADSKIVPDSNHVVILEDADIQSFQNAIVYIDTLNEFHTLDSGQIDIISRYAYTGEARYQYVNAVEDTFYIDFNAFRMEKYTQKKNDNRKFTMSDGYVAEEDSLFISPRIQYYGDVELDARENFLYFKGFVKIDLKGGFLSDWFAFEGRINPADVKIDLKDPKAADGTPLVTGLHITDGDSAKLYSTFIALKEMETDHNIMLTTGVFGYNPYQNEFMISDERKENGESLSGNVLVLNDSTSGIRYEGKFDFINGIPKKFEIEAGGNGEGNIKSGKYNFHTLLAVNFKVPGVIINQIFNVLDQASEGAWEPDVTNLSYRIAEIAGDNPAQLYTESGGEYMPLYSVSSQFNGPLVFSDLNLTWSSQYSAFYSPDSVGVSNVGKNDINAQIDGFVEIRRTFDGEQVDIYLQPDSATWIYLNYSNYTVSILSSDLALNAVVYDKSNVAKRSTPQDFAFQLGEFSMKEGFIYHYKSDYKFETLDTLDYTTLTEMQANLLTQINEFQNGGKTKAMEDEFGTEDEGDDSFFDDDLDESLDELDMDDLDLDEEEEEEDKLLDDDLETDVSDDDMDLSDDSDLDLGDDDIFNEEPEQTESNKKKKDKKKKEKVIEEDNEDSLLEEDTLLEDDDEPLFEDDDDEMIEEEDPWSEANKKIDKKKKKDKKKKEEEKPTEEEDSLFESLDDELDDLDE